MKKLHLILFLTLHFSLFTFHFSLAQQSGWFWQNPLPQGNSLSDVVFVSPSDGWAVGSHGTIIRTYDGGVNWSLQTSGVTCILRSVSFVEQDGNYFGTAVGEDGTIVHTANGGLTWIQQSSGISTDLSGVCLPMPAPALWQDMTA